MADENNVWFENTLYHTKPVIIHGNGPSKVKDLLFVEILQILYRL